MKEWLYMTETVKKTVLTPQKALWMFMKYKKIQYNITFKYEI